MSENEIIDDFPRDLSRQQTFVPKGGSSMTVAQAQENMERFLVELSNPSSRLNLQLKELHMTMESAKTAIFGNIGLTPRKPAKRSTTEN